jgi:hypothetical protein
MNRALAIALGVLVGLVALATLLANHGVIPRP